MRAPANAVARARFFALANLYITNTLLLVVAGASEAGLYSFAGTLASLAWSAIVLAVVSRSTVAAACST